MTLPGYFSVSFIFFFVLYIPIFFFSILADYHETRLRIARYEKSEQQEERTSLCAQTTPTAQQNTKQA